MLPPGRPRPGGAREKPTKEGGDLENEVLLILLMAEAAAVERSARELFLMLLLLLPSLLLQVAPS